MTGKGPGPEGLWRRVAETQDAAMAAAPLDGDALVRRLGGALEGRRRLPGLGWRPRVVLAAGLSLGGLAMAAMVFGVRATPDTGGPRLAFQLGHDGQPGSAGQALVAKARAELPLRFSDGSLVTFQPASRGRVARLDGVGAEILLERGRLEAEVVHADRTRWVVRAGPFEIRVTGTRFGVDWRPAGGQLAVDLREGGVVVAGGVLGAGVPLRAGQTLAVDSPAGVVEMRPLGSGEPESPDPGTAAAAKADPMQPRPEDGIDDETRSDSEGRTLVAVPDDRGARAPGPGWQRLARSGQFDRALAAAESAGFDGLLESLDAPSLLALGDVGRYAGRPDRAQRAFVRLVERFGHHPLAADAVFTLGRLAFEADQPGKAAAWFSRYVHDWPAGALAEQAQGRLVESAMRAGEVARAAEAARHYLAFHPAGAYAGLARSVLERAGGAP